MSSQGTKYRRLLVRCSNFLAREQNSQCRRQSYDIPTSSFFCRRCTCAFESVEDIGSEFASPLKMATEIPSSNEFQHGSGERPKVFVVSLT